MGKRSVAEIGDYVPTFKLPATTGETLNLGDFVGKPLVLFFYLQDGAERCASEACGFRDLHEQFRDLDVSVVGVGVDSIESHNAFAAQHQLPFPLLSDCDGKMCAEYGVLFARRQGEAAEVSVTRQTYIIDPNLRLAKVYTQIADPAAHAVEVLDDVRKLFPISSTLVRQHAPVLLVPHVLPPEICRRLIETWETQNVESGFMKEVDGKTVGMVDYGHKIRRDHYLRSGELHDAVKERVSDRVAWEIKKTFNYEVTRREDFRIACYDANRGGYFRPHRDNTTGGTAHRRFAMSLLLNEEYQGGYLRFPEYSSDRYRPPAGAAVVFSCSLLHEATDVTAGRRFVLLSFFYGEREARQREEYDRQTGGNYRA